MRKLEQERELVNNIKREQELYLKQEHDRELQREAREWINWEEFLHKCWELEEWSVIEQQRM